MFIGEVSPHVPILVPRFLRDRVGDCSLRMLISVVGKQRWTMKSDRGIRPRKLTISRAENSYDIYELDSHRLRLGCQ